MNITFHRQWLLVATCLLATACTTEKTIIREVPATTDAALADSTATDTGVLVPAAGTTTNTLITQTDVQVDTTAPSPEVENTVSPNMVDGIQTPAVESTISPNMVDGIQTPAVESTVTPNMVDDIPTPTVESTAIPNMVDGIQAPVVESAVAPNVVEGIQAPAVESTVAPDVVEGIQTPAVESTVAPELIEGIQSTGVAATDTESQSTNGILTPSDQGTDLFFDSVSTGSEPSEGTVTETGTTTSATEGTTAETATDTTALTTGSSATGTTAGTTTDTPAETTTASATDLFTQNAPTAPTIIGTPGMSVNCELTLPCRWISSDTQFSVTISNADNIGEQNRLSIEYSILTSHDTEVLIASTEPAVDENGLRYEPSALELGEGIGGTAQGIMAADEVTARIEFDQNSAAGSLSLWTIGLSDAGLIRQPAFSNIPVGSASKQFADCANTLPCVWVSPDANATITLLGVTGTGSTNRLSASFKVETTRNTVVAVDSGATAVGTDGMAYRGRTHAIGLQTGAEKLTANAVPGGQVAGTTFFFTTQNMSTNLQNLSLIIYEDSPVPRWNPSFLSVPVQ